MYSIQSQLDTILFKMVGGMQRLKHYVHDAYSWDLWSSFGLLRKLTNEWMSSPDVFLYFHLNFSPVIVLHSYNPLHYAYRRYRVCIFSGLCTKIVTSNVNMFNELAVHHNCVSFPYYVLHTFSWTIGKRIQYACSFCCA